MSPPILNTWDNAEKEALQVWTKKLWGYGLNFGFMFQNIKLAKRRVNFVANWYEGGS